MPTPAPTLPTDITQPTGLLHTLLTISLTAVAVLRPLYETEGGEIQDFAWVLLNPAGQQLLRQPACPTASLLTLFPTTQTTDVFAACCRAFETGESLRTQVSYQAAGLDAYFVFVAQRYEHVLVVNFTDSHEPPHSGGESARRESRARERAAYAEAEQQLRAVREELHHFFDQAPVGVSMVRGPQLVVELVNEQAATLLGSTQTQLLGRPLLEALPLLREQELEPLFARVLQGETFVFEELPVVVSRAHLGQPDLGYYRVIYQPWRRGTAEVIGMITIAVEVTEQVLARQQVEQLNAELEARVHERTQQTEQALAEAERQRRSLVELVQQAPAAMCIVSGPDFTYETFNPLYAAMFGGRPQVGRPMGEVLPEVVNHSGFLAFRAVYEQGRTIRQSEMLVPLARPGDGVLEDRYFSYTQQPRYDSQGQIDGVLVFAVEVTDQVLARQQVQALNEELTATNQDLHASNQQLTRTNVDLDTFVYTASHDLKAPITNIESIALALRSALPAPVQQDELVAHLLDLLEQTTARFRFTIGQLTDLSKLQLAHAGPAEPVKLAEILESVRLDLAPAIKEAEVQLTVEVAPDLLVSFSPANLRSILYNLLSNAVKYRALDRPAQAAVRAARTGQQVTVQVQDNGLGLTAHQQQRLFGLFQRLHTHVEGTGVGLYITKRLVENGGGTITVESHVDVGTTFTLTLPA